MYAENAIIAAYSADCRLDSCGCLCECAWGEVGDASDQIPLLHTQYHAIHTHVPVDYNGLTLAPGQLRYSSMNAKTFVSFGVGACCTDWQAFLGVEYTSMPWSVKETLTVVKLVQGTLVYRARPFLALVLHARSARKGLVR